MLCDDEGGSGRGLPRKALSPDLGWGSRGTPENAAPPPPLSWDLLSVNERAPVIEGPEQHLNSRPGNWRFPGLLSSAGCCCHCDLQPTSAGQDGPQPRCSVCDLDLPVQRWRVEEEAEGEVGSSGDQVARPGVTGRRWRGRHRRHLLLVVQVREGLCDEGTPTLGTEERAGNKIKMRGSRGLLSWDKGEGSLGDRDAGGPWTGMWERD